jgi:ferredoxin
MQNKVICKQDLINFVDNLIQKKAAEEIVGVKANDGKYAFGELANATELCLDYDVTLLPPKKYFLPQRETVLRFKLGDKPSVEPVVEAKPMIIIGVHPYDIKAIELCDVVYGSTNPPDPNYVLKRDRATILGVDCLNPNPEAFCSSLGTAAVESGFDLMVTDIGDSYVVAVGTAKGGELLKKYAETKDATESELAQRDNQRKQALGKYEVSLSMPPQEVPKLLEAVWDSPVFKEKSDNCLSCGSCVMVCPTCVCFDVQDDVALTLDKGERYRQWDGCMLVDFAKVATGENFREDREKRFRHRMYRKGVYLMARYGKLGCVGCGRCALACLAQIASPAETFNLLKEAS